MRDTIFDLLAGDLALNALGIDGSSLYAGDVDTPSQRPYGVLRWLDTAPGIDTVNNRGLVVWIHDTPGDYRKVDQVLARIRQILTNTAAYKTSTGWVVEIRWLFYSGDLTDDTTGTIARTGNFAIVASG